MLAVPLPPRRYRSVAVAAACAALALRALAGSGAAPWSVRPWQTDDGLPNNMITSVAQTADGYIWIATPSGLVRFDGVAFEAFKTKDYAPEITQKPVALLAAATGLWIAFDHGAAVHLDDGKFHLITPGMTDRVPQSMLIDAKGMLWVAFRAGILFRVTDSGPKSAINLDGFPTGYVCSIANDSDGHLWFGKEGHLGVFESDRFVDRAHIDRAVTRIAPDRNHGIWACVGHDLYHVEEGKPLEIRGSLTDLGRTTEPTALLEDRGGGVWIGTSDHGLYRYFNGRFESVPTSHRAITCLLEDREGTLWVGTDGGGINRIRPRAVTLENATTGLPFDTAQSVTQTTTGEVWAATQNGLLVRQVNDNWETVSLNADWPGGRPTTVAADANGGVWIGTKDYAVHHWLNGKYTSWRRADGMNAHTLHALCVASNGDVWLGEESPDQVQRIRGDAITTFDMPRGVRLIRAMAEDAAGDIWLGTSKGFLIRIHGQTVIDETAKITGKDGLRSVRYLRAMPDGKVWIAYADEGLGLYDHGRFSNLTMEQGLADNNLSQIVPDGAGWLWLGGDHGLFKARESELADVANGRAEFVRVVRYGQNEGLVSLQANSGDSPGGMQLRDGRILMPLRTALAVIDPHDEHRAAPSPPVIITRLVVNDTTIARYGGLMPVGDVPDLQHSGSSLRLPADHRRVEIDYTALSYAAPENVRFRYRLEGFDDDWVEAGTQRVVRYSRLSAGPYRFQVKACNGDGVWNETGATIAFEVAPFFWHTWWFRTTAVLVALSGAFVIVRQVSVRRLRRRVLALEQQTALDRERARIARDMHDDLGSRLTHVALLVELAQRAPTEARDQRMGQIAATVRHASESLDEIVWAINPVNDVFPRFLNYVGQYAVEFVGAAGLRCRVDLPDEMPAHAVSPEIRHNLFLVVKETLNNIVRHAEATEVRLCATIGLNDITLVIEDNGCGFADKTAAVGADGLRNMDERMREVGGHVEITSAPGNGTRVTIWLPSNRSANSPPTMSTTARSEIPAPVASTPTTL
jgi:signal transduction histidine kinase/ligand-binding sensor domain-containing protein